MLHFARLSARCVYLQVSDYERRSAYKEWLQVVQFFFFDARTAAEIRQQCFCHRHVKLTSTALWHTWAQ